MMARRLQAETPEGVGDSQYVRVVKGDTMSEFIKGSKIRFHDKETGFFHEGTIGEVYDTRFDLWENGAGSNWSKGQVSIDDDGVSSAAVILGRKGGQVKSEAKAAAVRANGKLGGRPSGKLIARWTDDIKVGIWDNESWTLRLYEDRALFKFPTVTWRGDSGSLEYASKRIEGRIHKALLKIALDEAADCEDYTEQVRQLIWDEMI
jgi:hypothetical protein